MGEIEGQYVESSAGLLFAVKGLVHPPGVVIAYLRYAPDPDGERQREGIRYRRFYRFAEQEEWLRARCPACLFFDPVFGERLQGVPNTHIRWVHDPCLKLAELRRKESLDGLEQQAVAFAALLRERAGVPQESLGISGSLLVGLHTPRSDLDIVVYGSEHCLAVHRALQGLLDEPGGEVRRLTEQEMQGLYAFRFQDTPLDFADFVRLEGRKVIQGKFRDREYFIRFIKAPAEVREHYGDRCYISLGQAQIEATVVDASEAIFTPCTYRVQTEHLLLETRDSPCSPVEIVSFRGRFCEQARPGERVSARGKLEKVVTRAGEFYHRLLLGAPGDWIWVVGNG